MKSASEFPHLEKFSKCWNQMQGSMKPAFNKQTQTQVDKAKMQKCGGCQTRILPSSASV